MSEKVEKALTDAGVFLGQDGLEKFANADAFWDEQPYGTRLYFGDGTTDYLQRGVLRAAIETLATIPDLRAALAKAEARIEPLLGQIACLEGLSTVYKKQREKAKAERDEVKRLLVTQTVDDIAAIIDADGAQKARSESLAAERDSERARADRYLAAMTEWVEAKAAHRAALDDLADHPGPKTEAATMTAAGRMFSVEATIRSLVEEARRG